MEPVAPPELVRLPAGGTEPFEPERIARSLFAAAERIGAADPFLARELTEGVVHFLAAECDGRPATPTQIAEVVAKVIRELGHPALAKAFEERPREVSPSPNLPATPRPSPKLPAWLDPSSPDDRVRRAAAAERLTELSIAEIYPRDLVSAHHEGLIRLTGLDAPLEIAGTVYRTSDDNVPHIIRAHRSIAGGFLAFDCPEYEFSLREKTPEMMDFISDVVDATRETGFKTVLNLNCGSPPRGYEELTGPLFGLTAAESPSNLRAKMAEELLFFGEEGRSFWHVAASDFDATPSRLNRPIELSLSGRAIEFVFDRPKQPVVLGPGLDRKTPATLCLVGVNFGRLVEQMGGGPVDPDVFLRKVGSLGRFAKTAGHVKQDFLRKYGRDSLREGFLLERARIVVVPTGLEIAATSCSRPAIEFGRQILQTLRIALESDRPRAMPVRVDSPVDDGGGISPIDPAATPKQQVRVASAWHAAAGGGCATIALPSADPAVALEILKSAWQGDVVRLRFVVG